MREAGSGEAGENGTRPPSPIAHRPSPFPHRPSPFSHRPSPIAQRPSTAASVKLLDFGIARVLSDDAPEHDLTRTGQRVLTPGTAAPEQVRGEPPTTATDVYALGGLLYRLLCGAPAVATAGRTAREIEQAVLDEAPRRASDALAPGAADARDTTDAALARRLRGDLDTICLTALAKEPERRYGSAADLLSDVQRHLDGLPIAARPATRRYRVGLFLRRHRTGVLATALGAAVLAGVVGFYTTRLAAERDRARTEAATAARVSDFLAGVFEYAIPAENAGRTLSTTELLERGAATLDSALADEPAVQARLMQVVARVYTRLGQFDRAVATGRASVARATAALGAAHPETAHSQAMLARALAERGAPADRTEADSLMGRAVAVLRADPDTDADLLGDVLGEWGWLRQELGHAREAVAINEEMLEVRTRANGARSAEAAVAMNNVGYAHYGAGRMAEAERWYRRALDIQRERLGPDNPEVATTLNNLGLALLERGAFDEAREAYAQVLAIDRATLDADHPFIAISLNNHAKTLQALGRYDEAEAAFREALAIRRRSLGARHAMIAQNLNNLGALASDRGDYSEAAALFAEAVEMSEAIEGATHPATAIYALSLVRALRRAGRTDEAARRLPAAVERMRTAYRGDATQLLKTAHEQALVRAARGDVPGGLAHLQRALRTVRARVAAGHPERLAAERSAAALLARAGRCAEARSAHASMQQRLDDTLPAALRTSLRRPLPACG
jgi:serine/threonine-protein kinase